MARLRKWRHTLAAVWAYMASLVSPQRAARQLQAGDEAPDFTLPGTDGKTYSLAQLKGRSVVLAWFPKVFTPGCTIECRSLRRNQALRQFPNVAYFMASVDTPENNREFAEQEGVDFPILSDPSRGVAIAYGVLNRAGMANRWTFYISPNGTIQAIDKKVSVTTSSEDIVSRLEELANP